MTDVLLDSNVVLRLLAIDDARHAIVADAVAGAIRDGHRVLLAPQVVAETWVVLTRPVDVKVSAGRQKSRTTRSKAP